MKNIVTLTVMPGSPLDEIDEHGGVEAEFELDDDRILLVYDINVASTQYDTTASLIYEIKEESKNGILEDLQDYFDLEKTKNWEQLERTGLDEIHLLFEEQFTLEQTESGPEADYYAEYLGILILDTLTMEANCFNAKEEE